MCPKDYDENQNPFTASGDLEDDSLLDVVLMEGTQDDSDDADEEPADEAPAEYYDLDDNDSAADDLDDDDDEEFVDDEG